MSASNIAKVRELVLTDPQMQKRLEATQGENAFTQALMAIGTEKGLAFTAADLEAWKLGEGASLELNEEQLTTVAGGQTRNKYSSSSYGTSYGNSFFCVFCSAGSYGD
jgi:predicted ribosomally synthesized peptide with nif11-like leader